jgi:ferredoxin-type protein NapG
MAMPPDDRPVGRRHFFRQGLRELLKPLAEAIEPMEEVLRQITELDSLPDAHRVARQVFLRPPGALPDKQFRDACSRCGDCVKVCPAQCIKIDSTGAKGNGAPYIDVETMPCVVCEGLLCMHACPTGALIPLPLAEIDMGTAVWNRTTCLRTGALAKETGDCTICVDRCPVGSVAIEVQGRDIQVHPQGCIGCGVCEFYCPTRPRSIVIIPKAARER